MANKRKMSPKRLDAWLITNLERVSIDLHTFDYNLKRWLYACIKTMYETRDKHDKT